MHYARMLKALQKTKRAGEAFSILEAYCIGQNFKSLAMVEVVKDCYAPFKPIGMVGFNSEWMKHYSIRGFRLIDPAIQMALTGKYRYFTFDTIKEHCSANSKAGRIFVEAEHFGIFDGIAVIMPTVRGTVIAAKIDGGAECVKGLSEQALHRLVSISQETLLKEVQFAQSEGEGVMPPTVTKRCAEILPFVLQGMTNKEIAKVQNCSEDAIKDLMERLYVDFGLKDSAYNKRVVLAAKATTAGYFPPKAIFS